MVPGQEPNPAAKTAVGMSALVGFEACCLMSFVIDGGAALFILSLAVVAVAAIAAAARSRSRGVVIAVGAVALVVVPAVLVAIFLHAMAQDHS